jgi:maltokinase
VTDADLTGRLDPDRRSLLPAHRLEAGEEPPELVRVVASGLLAEGVWLTVLEGETLLTAPLVPGGNGLRRARPGDGAATALLERLRSDRSIPGFTVVTASGERQPSPRRRSYGSERAMSVDQTHESVVVDDRVVVKWAVRAEPSPAPTVVTHLAEAGFAEMPQPEAFVLWSDARGEPVVVASVMAYLGEALNGWTWGVTDVREGLATGDLGASLKAMRAVGETVGDLHLAMATPTRVLPEPSTQASAGDIAGWQQLALRLLDEAIGVGGDEAQAFAARRERIVEVLRTMEQLVQTPVIPVHGDLHVGQVLRWSGGYAIADFDGNPVLPVERRLDPQPAARDVAGMLQSIDHVGRVVCRRVPDADPEQVEAWIVAAQQAFLGAYRARLLGGGQPELLDERLLMPFQVEQECRELVYAGRHDTRWRYVPHQAVQALLP